MLIIKNMFSKKYFSGHVLSYCFLSFLVTEKCSDFYKKFAIILCPNKICCSPKGGPFAGPGQGGSPFAGPGQWIPFFWTTGGSSPPCWPKGSPFLLAMRPPFAGQRGVPRFIGQGGPFYWPNGCFLFLAKGSPRFCWPKGGLIGQSKTDHFNWGWVTLLIPNFILLFRNFFPDN